MPPEVTAEFLLFMNKLFDSVNGCSRFAPVHCPLRCWVSDFWNEALVMLEILQFVDCVSGKVTRLRSHDGCITTIRAMQMLWILVFTAKNIKLRWTGALFSAIWQHGGGSINPAAGLHKKSAKMTRADFCQAWSLFDRWHQEDFNHLLYDELLYFR
ncbi:hypothetical protein PR048_007422 [Dryococelus australis]|uniref:Uncharacterized protein n=1 Tax=Dryococelus australis TaxID=614101 RepID=A0ABQ9HU81_9NEOP|nr:hypothetical protein PR048_007422 [Dryococelus australis]